MEKIEDKEILQSKTIDFLRFPLIMGVVLIHSFGILNDDSMFYPIAYLISQVFSRIAVPLFFFISGYLFFYKKNKFNFSIYKTKLHKHFYSLLVPYLFWNILIFLLIFLRQKYLPFFSTGENFTLSYNLKDFIQIFWVAHTPALDNTYPICYQFWFIRDLIVLNIFSPLIYLLIKKLNYIYIVLLALIWMVPFGEDIAGFSRSGWFFFSLGSFISLNSKNILLIPFTQLKKWGLVYLLISFVIVFFRDETWISVIKNMNILIGMFTVLSGTAFYLKNKECKGNVFLLKSNFFIYAYHGLTLQWLSSLLIKIVHPSNDITFFMLYIISPLLVVVIGLFIFYIFEKMFPRTLAFMIGKRN